MPFVHHENVGMRALGRCRNSPILTWYPAPLLDHGHWSPLLFSIGISLHLDCGHWSSPLFSIGFSIHHSIECSVGLCYGSTGPSVVQWHWCWWSSELGVRPGVTLVLVSVLELRGIWGFRWHWPDVSLDNQKMSLVRDKRLQACLDEHLVI